jgi:enoyl-CoA hydratase/carnithine racemase
MAFEHIQYAVEDRIATITLNRPDHLNAFSSTMLRELLQAIDKVDADDEVRVLVVTGAGRGFCAGADLSSGTGDSFYDSSKTIDDFRDGGGFVPLRIFQMKKPVIAAINGPAVGVGITMTLPMDVRIASEKARMGFVFTRRGIAPDACSSWFLPRIVGIGQATEWVLSGRVFPAEEALRGGLVSRLVPPDQLIPTARELAREIADNTSAISVALSRQLLWRMLDADHPMEAHRWESKSIYYTGRSADSNEGVASFFEKRPPNFTMKPSQDMPDFYPWWGEPDFKED